jgi:hypothetical protein
MFAIKQIVEETNTIFWLKKNGKFEEGYSDIQLFTKEFAELKTSELEEELSCCFGVFGVQYKIEKVSLELVWNKEENCFTLQKKNE